MYHQGIITSLHIIFDHMVVQISSDFSQYLFWTLQLRLFSECSLHQILLLGIPEKSYDVETHPEYTYLSNFS